MKSLSPAFLLFTLLLFSACTGSSTDSGTEASSTEPEETVAPPAQEPADRGLTMTEESLPEFWTAFQQAVGAQDKEAVADRIAFPLRGGQYLIGKPGQGVGIQRQELLDNFDKVFDREAREKILATPAEELEAVELDPASYPVAGPDKTGYRLMVSYDMEEETESTLLYTIGKTAEGYKIVGIDFAG